MDSELKYHFENSADNVLIFKTLSEKGFVFAEQENFYFGKSSFLCKVYDKENQAYAIKVFLDNHYKIERHYNALQEHAAMYVSPITCTFTFFDKELTITGLGQKYQHLPILVMPWVSGKTLRARLTDLCSAGETQGIMHLYEAFKKCIQQKWDHGMVHGDISDTNIMVAKEGNMVLVDYDTLYHESLDSNPIIVPLTNSFLHPQRTSYKHSNKGDDFPTLLLATTIYALGKKTGLLAKYITDDGLLFSKATIYQWETSDLKKELEAIDDPYLNNLLFGIKISLNKIDFGINGLADYFFDEDPASEIRQGQLQIAFLHSCLEQTQYNVQGLNNEIARQTITADKMRYEKKILEEEVKLFKQQKAAKNTQRPFFKLALIAGIIIGCLAILAIMVFKQKSKSSSDLVNQSKAVTNDTVKQSANKMPEAGNDTDYKPAAQANAPVLPTIRQDTIPTNKTGPIDSASSKIAMVQPFAPNKVAANNNVATAPLPPASTSNTAGSNFKSPKNNPKYKNAEKHQKKATVVFKSIY